MTELQKIFVGLDASKDALLPPIRKKTINLIPYIVGNGLMIQCKNLAEQENLWQILAGKAIQYNDGFVLFPSNLIENK